MKISFEKNREGFRRPGKIPSIKYSPGEGCKTVFKRGLVIEQWDGINDLFIKEYKSIREAADEVEINPGTISRAIKTNKMDYKGFIWKVEPKQAEFSEVTPEIKDKTDKDPYKKHSVGRKCLIEQWDSSTGKLVKIWISLRAAALELDRNLIVLRKCVNGGQPDWKGFIWKKKTS